jgi:hypothetical protein
MVLVDCNDSADETTQVVHVLKRDNLFRTKFGDYAPSVYITDTDYNDSTLELF